VRLWAPCCVVGVQEDDDDAPGEEEYAVLRLLRVLYGLNRHAGSLLGGGAEGAVATALALREEAWVNKTLSERLALHLKDPLALALLSFPPWCEQVLAACFFLFPLKVGMHPCNSTRKSSNRLPCARCLRRWANLTRQHGLCTGTEGVVLQHVLRAVARAAPPVAAAGAGCVRPGQQQGPLGPGRFDAEHGARAAAPQGP
jgi:hypothetical protein